MTKKEQELLSYYENCIDQLSYVYIQSLNKKEELKDYISLLQNILCHYDITFPPLEKPIKF